MARFNDAIESIQWDEMVFLNGAQPIRLRFPEACMDARLDMLNQAARDGKDFGEFIRAIGSVA